MQCIFYDFKLGKQIPCLLDKNVIHDVETRFDKKYYVHVSFDDTKYTQYNTNRDELIRYSSEFVSINEIYPATIQAELDYINETFPKKYAKSSIPFLTTTTHSSDELDRFEKIIDMITDVVGNISRDNFIKLIDFINYELVFTYCNQTERDFLDTLSESQLVSQPGTTEVPQILRMLIRIFSKADSSWYTSPNDTYKIINRRNFSGFDSDFPFIIDLVNLEYNVNFITGL